jgi:MFS transporter, FSR family, fosmidomycin resistance protein
VSATAAGVDRRAMLTLSGGHMFTDIAQGSVPALLPFLKAADHLSLAALSALVLAATISSSVIQPLFGHVSDRVSLPWLMPLGPALGGLGIALAGFAPSYGLTFAAIVLSGLGVAAFHPEGSRFANYVSGARRARGMSLFSVGGNIGFALGPVLVTPLLLTFGLHGTAFVIIPTGLMAVVLLHELPRLERFRVDLVAGKVQRGEHAAAWGPFVRLAGVIALRSFVYFGMVTFIPLYYVAVLHTGEALGSAALTAMLIGGAAGTLAGGPLADRFGRRAVLVGSMLLIPPLVPAGADWGRVRGDDRPLDRARRDRCAAAGPDRGRARPPSGVRGGGGAAARSPGAGPHAAAANARGVAARNHRTPATGRIAGSYGVTNRRPRDTWLGRRVCGPMRASRTTPHSGP